MSRYKPPHDDEDQPPYERNQRREPPLSRGAAPKRDDFYIEPDDRPTRPRREAPVRVTYQDEYEKPPRRDDYYDDEPPQRPRRLKPKRRFSFFRFLFKWTFIAACWAFIAGLGVIGYFYAQMPPLADVKAPARPPNIQILYADGSRMADRGVMGAPAVPIESLPKHTTNALIAIEDRRFYSHFGIDLVGFARAMHSNITRTRGPLQGGSTLTQQLAKNLFLTQDRTFSRKVQEGILALRLEYLYSKKEILSLYMNRVYYGGGAYGIEAAANRFYGKPATKLTLKESAIIAGLVQAPSRLNPLRHKEAAETRAKLVLNAMKSQNLISDTELQVALADPAPVNRKSGNAANNYVADWVIDLLDDYIGKYSEDITVQTTLSSSLQAVSERIVLDELKKQGDKLNIEQSALVVMGLNGEILAMIGGKNYEESQFNRAVTAKRQPGSAFKPFVYLAAVQSGFTADMVKNDAPFSIGKWSPENYTRDFKGDMTLAQAMAHSTNTIAVQLGQDVTPKLVIRTAQNMGIDSKLEPNPALPLGTSEVTLLELTKAYIPFANGGLSATPNLIRMIFTTGDKRQLYSRTKYSQGRIIEPAHLAQMQAMLHEVVKSGTGRRASLPQWAIAGKTGTTSDFRDAWFVGYSGRYITGVWAGNDDAEPMKRVTGGGFPIDIWNRIMAEAHKGQKPVDLPPVGWRNIPTDLPMQQAENPRDPIGRIITQDEKPIFRERQPLPPPSRDGIGGLFERIFGR